MDIPSRRRPDIRHMFTLKWSQQEMAGSRSFLAVLVVATVTCIILIQVSMDGWIHPGNFKFYNIAIINQKNLKIDKNEDIPEVAHSTKYATTASFTALKQMTPRMQKTMAVKPTKNIQTKTATAVFQQKTPIKVIGNLTIKGPINVYHKQLLPINQDKLKTITKYRNTLQKRLKTDLVRRIKVMPSVDPATVNRIFLITYFRSGSSFVGELLQQNWKTFYQFEPLHYMTYGSRISDINKTREAFDLFNNIYLCNFTGLDNYFQWVRRAKNQFLFSRSIFLWYTCRVNHHVCFMPDYVSTVCSRAPVVIIKTTRLHMWQLKQFLDENPDLNVKVVYLARDPRGIVSSRWSLSDWCNGTDCSDPNIICSEMRNDISVFNELQRKDPSKFIQVRYEDMATNPEMEASKLFQFLGLPLTHSIKSYLKIHTKARKSDKLDPYSTRRDSSTAAYSWKKRFNFEQVVTVQKMCYDVIGQLNYSMIYNASDLETLDDTEKDSVKATKPKITYINNHRNSLEETHSLNTELIHDHPEYLKNDIRLPKVTAQTKISSDKNLNEKTNAV